MVFAILILAVIIFISWKAAPKEKKEHAHVHGAGQIGLLAAVALFGVDYFHLLFLCHRRDDERPASLWATELCLHCRRRDCLWQPGLWCAVYVFAGGF